jgi:hypothetical protein
MPNIFGDLSDFFSGLIGGPTSNLVQGATALPSAVENWFAGIGGQIASGFEAGIVALFKDSWDVFIGPFEVGLGIILIVVGIVFMFKDDLMQLAPLIAMAAA